MKQFLSLSCITLLLFACAGKGNASKEKKQTDSTKEVKTETKAVAENKLPFIDLNKEYPKKTIKIEDIADIEYIPLETRDDVLLRSIGGATVSIDFIITSEWKEGRIFFFNRKGKFLNSFSHEGSGPQEYRDFMGYTADFEAKEVYIKDHPAMNRILVYSFSGEFKRILNLQKKIYIWQMFDYDKDFLICSWNANDDTENKTKMNKNPYIFICKKTGKFKPLPFTVENPVSNRIRIKKDEYNSMVFKIGIEPITKSANEFAISDLSLDTSYIFKNEILTPLAVRNISAQTGPHPILSSISWMSDQYLFFDICELKLDQSKTKLDMESSKELICDRKTGEIYKPEFISSDIMDKKITMHSRGGVPANHVQARIGDAETLIELYNENRLRGKLKKVVSTLKEDDNPVLMLIKFKE